MPAIQPLCFLIGVNPQHLSREENLLLEAELYAQVYEELKEIFRSQYKNYFFLMKFTTEMEDVMLEEKFARLIIHDLMLTGEYDIKGIACYTNTHEEVIEEVATGRNTNPSAKLLRRMIDLHRSVRRELYHSIFNKIKKRDLMGVVA